MDDWISAAVWAGTGTVQEGADLPTSVPGIDSGNGAAEGQIPPAGTGGPGTTQPAFNPLFLMLLLVIVFMIVTTMMSSRREKRRVSSMIGALKRGDRVQTLAGMIGTIHEVKDDSIVLRVDETTGTRIHFAKSAVQAVLKSAKSDSRSETVESAG
jgi:preprotein translocase subunit YajC